MSDHALAWLGAVCGIIAIVEALVIAAFPSRFNLEKTGTRSEARTPSLNRWPRSTPAVVGPTSETDPGEPVAILGVIFVILSIVVTDFAGHASAIAHWLSLGAVLVTAIADLALAVVVFRRRALPGAMVFSVVLLLVVAVLRSFFASWFANPPLSERRFEGIQATINRHASLAERISAVEKKYDALPVVVHLSLILLGWVLMAGIGTLLLVRVCWVLVMVFRGGQVRPTRLHHAAVVVVLIVVATLLGSGILSSAIGRLWYRGSIRVSANGAGQTSTPFAGLRGDATPGIALSRGAHGEAIQIAYCGEQALISIDYRDAAQTRFTRLKFDGTQPQALPLPTGARFPLTIRVLTTRNFWMTITFTSRPKLNQYLSAQGPIEASEFRAAGYACNI